jgi:hypothetical protein
MMHTDENYIIQKYTNWSLWVLAFSLAVYSVTKKNLDIISLLVVLCNIINYMHLFDAEGYRYMNRPMQNIRQIIVFCTNGAILQILMNFVFINSKIFSLFTSMICCLITPIAAIYVASKGSLENLEVTSFSIVLFDYILLLILYISFLTICHLMINFGER